MISLSCREQPRSDHSQQKFAGNYRPGSRYRYHRLGGVGKAVGVQPVGHEDVTTASLAAG